jgi:hypothetical protein
MLVIYFSNLCKVFWWFVMNINNRQQLPKRFFARNSDMILVPTVGLCRAFMFVPLNEQGMAVEGERIWIASEEHFTSINHSFDGSTLGKTSFMCFSCHESFEVLP